MLLAPKSSFSRLLALSAEVGYESARRSNGNGIVVFADNHANFSTDFYLTHHPNSVVYTKMLQKLNMKYYYALSGVETVNNNGGEVDKDNTIISMLHGLARNSKFFGDEAWLVIGNPLAISRIAPIIHTMPERIVFKKNQLCIPCCVV